MRQYFEDESNIREITAKPTRRVLHFCKMVLFFSALEFLEGMHSKALFVSAEY